MTQKRILITGSRGQLGLALQACAPSGWTVQGVDVDTLDITDAVAVREAVAAFAPDAIINCAAYTAVDRAETEADAAFRINRDGAAHLAAAAAGVGARMVQVSTDFVFDGRQSLPYRPDAKPNPLGVYGHSKLAGEQTVAQAAPDALIVRTAWLYSAHGGNFVKTMLRLLREKPELRVVADQIGTPTSADSLAQALWALLAADASAGCYHYTDAGVASWYDFAVAIAQIMREQYGESLAPVFPIRTEDYPTPAQRPAYSVLDKTDTVAITGPLRHWREPLAEVLHQLREG
jgi:dTDP-4-dehydrorhamnose reductase